MTDTPFIDHREIKRTRDLSRSVDSLELIKGLSPVALLKAHDEDAPDDQLGFLVSRDDRCVVKLITPEEAAAVGRETVGFDELIAFVDRCSRLGELEDAATEAQAAYVRIRRLFGICADHIIKGTPITTKERRAIGALHHELNEIDAENAEAERRAREANNQFHRDRMLGIKLTAAKFGLPTQRGAA